MYVPTGESMSERLLEVYLDCALDQFVKATGGSAGYDVRCQELALVPSLKTREEGGFYDWVETQPIASFKEAEREAIEAKSTTDPLNRNIFRIKGDKQFLVKGFEQDSSYPGSDGKSYYLSPEGIVHYKRYEPFLLKTGIVMPERPSNRCWFLITMRSGTATKKGIMFPNSIGVIDEDYPKEWMLTTLAVHHDTIVEAGERVAQAIVIPAVPASILRKNSMESGFGLDFGGDYGGEYRGEYSIRTGGLGSTGV